MSEPSGVLPEKILLVDDSPANLRLLSQIFMEQGYQVRAVTNGARALASAQIEPPDLILLDIRMPGMDGYEVCRQLKDNPLTRAIPVLFISALDEIQDKIRAFSAGGLDYITKPFQMEEVLARVRTHLALRRLTNDLEQANQRMERELMLAAQVQASIMHTHLPSLPGWQTAVRLIPAKQTCGDFFDLIRLPDGSAAVLIADVVDKGVGAALYMAMCCALLRTAINDHPHHPEQGLQAVNERILQDTESDQFVTVFLGFFDPRTGKMVYANAGHNPPALIHQDGPAPATFLTHTGPALGVIEGQSYAAGQVQICPGEALVLYTDGVTDAESPSQGFYGSERLIQQANAGRNLPADAMLEAILDSVRQFTGDAPQSDDIALMILKHE